MLSRGISVFATVCVSLHVALVRGQLVDFEDLTLAPDSYYNGADGAGGFSSRGASFNNSFTDYGGGVTSWEGWAYSNMTDTPATADPDAPDYQYEYSAVTGIGSRGSANYGLAYTNTFTLPAPIITLPAGAHPLSLQVTNTLYDYLSMKNGDQFAKQFAGPSGNTPGDWFKLTVTGLNSSSQPIGSVDFYLSDFRSPAPSQQFIVNTWQNVDLMSLFGATALSFSLSSSDTGSFGMNTPAFFAADDLSLTKQAGDTNGDGIVNGLDIAMIASHWLQTGPVADANGDGLVNGLDIAMVASHWLAGGGAAAAVPEPPTALLALAGLALLVLPIKLRP